VRQWLAEVFRAVLSVVRRVMFPRSGSSLGYARRGLLAGTRVSTIAIGVCLVVGVHQWWEWVVIGCAVACLVADLPLAYKDRRRASGGVEELDQRG
jgi:hypothetical protein